MTDAETMLVLWCRETKGKGRGRGRKRKRGREEEQEEEKEVKKKKWKNIRAVKVKEGHDFSTAAFDEIFKNAEQNI